MVQVILFGLLSVPAVGWVVGRLLSEGSPLDPLDLIWTLQAQHSRMMCVRISFSVQLMQRRPGWREEECEERERGRRRSVRRDSEMERKSAMAIREERNVQVVPSSGLIVFSCQRFVCLFCSVKVLFVCPTLTRQSRASVFVTREGVQVRCS